MNPHSVLRMSVKSFLFAQAGIPFMLKYKHASDWAWLHEPMLVHWGIGPGCGDSWAYPGYGVTFEPHQVALWAWKEVKGEAMSVNEAL